MPDFRTDPMESAEGKGNARRVWDAYVRGTNKLLGPALHPLLKPAADRIGGAVATDLMGFWLCWHLEGGFEGLLRMGMSRSAIYRRVKMFRSVFGEHPDSYQLPGVSIDVKAYLEESRKQRKKS